MTSKIDKSFLYDVAIWGEVDASSGKKAKDENFPVGSLLISKKLRPHVQIYYNFARAIDDIADSELLNSEEKINRLNAMEAVLCQDVRAPDRADALTARHLRNSLLETEVPSETATDLLIAFRQDAVKTRYKSWDELLKYCQYSANPVGRYLLALHKENERTKIPSDALCTSLQILNHLQDCKQDLQRLDRCYIPEDMLQAEGASVTNLTDDRTSIQLRKVFDKILDRVEQLNQQADDLPRLIVNRRLRLESAIIVKLARYLTDHLRKEDPLAQRVKLSFKDVFFSTGQIIRYFI